MRSLRLGSHVKEGFAVRIGNSAQGSFRPIPSAARETPAPGLDVARLDSRGTVPSEMCLEIVLRNEQTFDKVIIWQWMLWLLQIRIWMILK